MLLRAGVVLPTATWDDAYDSVATSPARVIDVPAIALDGWWTRLSVSPRVDRGTWFMQIDLGIDQPHDRDHLYSDYQSSTSPLLHVDAAVGVRHHELAFTAEGAVYMLYSNEITAVRVDGSVAATVRYLGELEPYLGLVRPIDVDYRGPSLVVTLGIEGTLP